MSNEVEHWRELASRLRIDVTAPVTLAVGDGNATFTALLRQFGGKNGMIVDSNFEAIRPYTKTLLGSGYGYSAMEIGEGSSDEGDEYAKEVLRDWGWSAAGAKPSWW